MCLHVLGMIGQTSLSVNSHFDGKKPKTYEKGAWCYEDNLFAIAIIWWLNPPFLMSEWWNQCALKTPHWKNTSL